MTEELRDTIITRIVDELSPLTHTERDTVLKSLVSYRLHWFARPVVRKALDQVGLGVKG